MSYRSIHSEMQYSVSIGTEKTLDYVHWETVDTDDNINSLWSNIPRDKKIPAKGQETGALIGL